MLNKHNRTEEDIKRLFITPNLEAKWDKEQIWMEYFFTDGRVILRGDRTDRAEGKKADYVLFYRKRSSYLPLAVVEAKDNKHSVNDGMQQAIEYAEILDVPFAYSSNGDAFVEHDMAAGKERQLRLGDFPSPDELWQRYTGGKQYTPQQESLITQPYYYAQGEKIPRYYQRVAINRTVDAIARGQNRILLVMATGTGKTYTAFQIIHRLWKSGNRKKILYLADRNILIDQTMIQDFKPFEKVMTKIEGRKMDSSYEIYMSLYHQLAGDEGDEPFREFQPGFFDLIIVDECHRGSARDESRWRRILEYFSGAVQIGMTATPKETKDISNIDYFGEPLYTYSLKQGIDDGFLAPFKVVRVGINKDLEGYRPEKGKTDIYGNIIEDREYNVTDYDKNLVIDERTQEVARKITQFLKTHDRMSKTIVFCIDQEHASRMRKALVNENADLFAEDSRYIVRITSDDDVGKKQLENFIDKNEKYPVIVTTSELMSTGVDCKTCKLIVLDKEITSPIEFKQIIGRGTRLEPAYDKMYFTIMDFRGVCRQFANDDFWVNPEQDEEFGEEKDPYEYPDDNHTGEREVHDDTEAHAKIYIDGVSIEIISERVQYYDVNGKLITESITDYSKKNILREYATLDKFLKTWNNDIRKQAIIDELKEKGVLLEALRDCAASSGAGNKDIDDFDLICHIAFDKKPLTKLERINEVKKRDYLSKYEGVCREIIAALLDKYADEGIKDLEDTDILEVSPFNKIGALKIVKAFGGEDGYYKALKDLQDAIYAA
ncbi:DEAD/DEAH box helicase [Spirochaetia bacterium]|nr:DEAD/DEAH box helicase [Spirochaetia bacterium]